jgi:hypothetical protein
MKGKRKKMENNLPYPYSEALKRDNSIDYRVGGWSEESDHDYVRKLGYTPEMGGDCSYSAKGLNGFNLSSYGDWGTFFPSWANEESWKIFFGMYEKGIIKLWSITAYIKVNGEVQAFSYENGAGWRTNDPEYGWIDYTGDPYKNFPE